MAIFDDREKAFENKYKHDQELQFKVTVRRAKLMGLWAAEKLGLSSADAEAYAKETVAADLAEAGDADLIRKLMADFSAKGVSVSEADVNAALNRTLEEAKQQIQTGS